MDIKIIHKEIIVHLFLIVLISKTVIMFIKPDLFEKVREKTKVLEMILGPAILGTGIYAWVDKGYPISAMWIWVKLILMLVAVGLTIVGFKKGNKVMAVAAVFIFVLVYLLALKRYAWGLA